MKKILITGAAGFIGSNLIRTLRKQECEMAVINRTLKEHDDPIKQYIGDITNYDFVLETIKDFQPTNIFHLAAYKERSASVEDIRTFLNVNLTGTLNLYEALLKINCVSSIVTLGTTDEYGDCDSPYIEDLKEKPTTAYGFSKLCVSKLSEFFYKNFNLPVTVFRPTIAYGPNQGMEMFIPSLINTLLKGGGYKMTKGEQIRDFIYISDLVDAMILIDKKEEFKGEIFNIGSGESIKIRTVSELIAKELDKSHLLKIGAIEYREREIMHYKTSIEKANKIMNWSPKISFKKGIELTVKHYRDNG
jgi:UDP-glucose 4-epimerase